MDTFNQTKPCSQHYNTNYFSFTSITANEKERARYSVNFIYCVGTYTKNSIYIYICLIAIGEIISPNYYIRFLKINKLFLYFPILDKKKIVDNKMGTK